MFCKYSRVLKIPLDIVSLRKLTPISTGVTSKCITAENGTLLHRNYNTDTKNGNENLRMPQYKYLCYSILCGAVAYTSYKIW